MNRSAVLLGVSELIGAEYLKILVAEDSFDKVHATVRTPPGLDRSKPVQRTVLVDELEATSVARASLAAPRQAVSNNAGAFLMISAVGADGQSGTFYNRVKEETERDHKNVESKHLVSFCPSLVLRGRKEARASARMEPC